MAKKRKKPIVSLRWKSLSRLGNFIIRVRGIILSFTNNAATFPAPVPAVANMTTLVDDLETTNDVVQTRVAGSVTARNIAYNAVVDAIELWQDYVQGLANAESDFETAKNIINLSGFDVKIDGVFEKPPLSVKTTITPGQVKLIAKAAAKRASYNWQMSLNNGTTWTDLPTTLKANTLVSGLTSKSYYVFRVRPVTKDGPGAWTSPVGIVIQ